MKVLLIGGTGQLGQDYLFHSAAAGVEVTALHHGEIEVADPASVSAVLSGREFDLLINTSAYHGYAAYEDANPDRFFGTNVFGPYYLALYCAEHQAKLIHFSTDYVFSGNSISQDESFTETVVPVPGNLYAASKYAGELIIPTVLDAHFIFRVASVYGVAGCRAKNSSNFVEMILGRLANGETIDVVDDIVVSPVSTHAIVWKTLEVARTQEYGLYHLAGKGRCTWYQFARRIAELSGYDPARIVRSDTSEVAQEVKRGNNTSLDNQRLRDRGFSDVEEWEAQLERYLDERKTRIEQPAID